MQSVSNSKKKPAESKSASFPEENNILTSALNAIGSGVVITDSGGNIQYYNETVRKEYGESFHLEMIDWINKYQIINAKTGKKYKLEDLPLFKALTKKKITENEEIIVLNEKKIYKELRLSAFPVLNNEGKVVNGVLVYHDISSVKRKEEELKEAIHDRDLLFTAMETSSDIVVATDFYGKILYLNKSAQETFRAGLVKDLSKIDIKEYHAPESWEKVRNEMIPEAIKKGSSTGELTLLKKDGTIIHVSQVLVCKKNVSGDVDFFASVSRDITALKEKENQLSRQQNYVQSILDANPNLVWVKNPDGKYSFVNKRYSEVSGKEIIEILEKHDFDLYGTNASLLEHQTQDRMVIKDKKTIIVKEERYFDHSVNEERWYQTVKTPLKSIDGKSIQVLGVSADITELKVALQSLKRQTELNEIILKISSDFLNCNIESFNNAVIQSLKTVCKQISMNRAAINQSSIGENIKYLHVWAENTDDPLMKGYFTMEKFKLEDFKWVFTQLKEKGYAFSGDMKRQSKAMLEMQILNDVNVKSFIVFPMLSKKYDIKYLILSSNNEVNLSESDIVFIQTYSQILSSAMERMHTEKLLNEKLLLEELITKISSGFINIETEDITTEINKALKNIAEFLGADQGYVFSFNEIEKTHNLTNYWFKGDLELDMWAYFGIKEDDYPWAFQEIRKNNLLIVSNPDKLPEKAKALKDILNLGGVKSMFGVPVIFGNRFAGAVVFASFEKNHFWADDTIPMIRIFGQILANAFERRKKEKELKDSEWLYRTLANNIPNSDVIVFDKELKFKIVEGKNYLESGITREQIEGKYIKDILSKSNRIKNAEDFSEYETHFKKVLEGEEFEFERNYNDNKYYKIYIFPIRNAAKEVVSGMLMSLDITEFKEIQNKLHKQALELKSSNEDMEQFAYVASHDLQEPLRMVSSYVHLIGRKLGTNLTPEMKEFIFYATDGVQRMQELINGLLEYSRIERKGKPFVNVDLNKLIQGVKFSLHKVIMERNVTIIHPELPVVKGDHSQLTSLFQNLIDNAIKFKGKKDPVIEIGVKENKDSYSFFVKDNGIGIEPKFFNKIFVVFQRLNYRTEYPGTGIGLSVCKKIVDRHGGRISVESEPGKGTTFFFDLKK